MTTLFLSILLLASTPSNTVKAPDTLRVGDTLTWTFTVERVLPNLAGMDVKESSYRLIITETLDSLVKGKFVETHDKKRDVPVYRALDKAAKEKGGAKEVYAYSPNPFEGGSATVMLNAGTGKLLSVEADSVIAYYRVLYMTQPVQPSKEQFLEYTGSDLQRFWSNLRPEIPDSVLRTESDRVEFVKTSESSYRSIKVGEKGDGTETVTTTITTDTWEIGRVADTVHTETNYKFTSVNRSGTTSIASQRLINFDSRWHSAFPVLTEVSTEGFGTPGSTRIMIKQEPWRRKQTRN
ncbi:MAG: hypothetical protein EHM43_02265 [Ignavibacteriae bacterium]|nr:MAG: hypothetical protein EHM43_02265 [Ignavibacteriota bacterium]